MSLYSFYTRGIQWFTEHHDDNDGDFMLIKYRADLLYLQKQYSAAVPGYEASLRSVPPSNGVVVRELTESLARCWLHLERPRLALEKACLLVSSVCAYVVWCVCLRALDGLCN